MLQTTFCVALDKFTYSLYEFNRMIGTFGKCIASIAAKSMHCIEMEYVHIILSSWPA